MPRRCAAAEPGRHSTRPAVAAATPSEPSAASWWRSRATAGGQDRFAKPHDVRSGRELLTGGLADLPNTQAIVADRAYRGLAKLAAKRQVQLDIKMPPKGVKGFTPIAPLYRIEHTFARLGRWRRQARCYGGSAASARAWLEVASVGHMLTLLREEPT